MMQRSNGLNKITTHCIDVNAVFTWTQHSFTVLLCVNILKKVREM